MDNVHNCDSYINIPSSQTSKSYIHIHILYHNSLLQHATFLLMPILH
jgi:hypothetical protein